MQLQQYQTDFLKSRGYDQYDIIYCEIEGCGKVAVDINHITCSYRGKRKHNPDGSDLIANCREHHNDFHAHSSFEERERLLERVVFILSKKI